MDIAGDRLMDIEEYPWGLLARKPCAPGNFLAVALIVVLSWLILRGLRGSVAEPAFAFLVLAAATGTSLLFLECLWSRTEIDWERRVIDFFTFGRLWRSIRFDEIRDIAANWDGEGFLIPMVRLKNGAVVRFFLTQAPTRRSKANEIQHGIAAMQRALSA
jgi:hypothetical protein